MHYIVPPKGSTPHVGLYEGNINQGDVLPALVVKVVTEGVVNLRVFCNGPSDEFIEEVFFHMSPGGWMFPPRV